MNESIELEEFVTMNKKTLKALSEKVEEKITQNFGDNCEKNTAKVAKNDTITSIKDVPAGELFTRRTIWRAMNLKTMIIFELSGWNVDLYVGENSTLRALLENGKTDSFQKNGLFIQFHHYTK